MFDFSKVVDRHGTWCTQWDYVADRFGTADLLPFTISDMDFATAPCIIEALNQRLIHGVFGYSRWKNDEFLAAIAHWFSTQHYTAIDPQSVVYGPSVIYMVSELIRQWSETGEGVVIHSLITLSSVSSFTASMALSNRLPRQMLISSAFISASCGTSVLAVTFIPAFSAISAL